MVDPGETICDCKCYRAGIEAAADELTALRAKVAAGEQLRNQLHESLNGRIVPMIGFSDEEALAFAETALRDYDAAVKP